MIYYVLSRSWGYLAVDALLLLVLAGVVSNSLRRATQPPPPLGFGLYGLRLALGVAVGLAILMALSIEIGGSGSVWEFLFVAIGLLFAWFFVVVWASVALCTFFVFFATAWFAALRDKKPRHAEQSLAAESR
jgi:uncharacterized membrane protein